MVNIQSKMPKYKSNKIWIDADACPKAVKEIVFKTSQRLNIAIVLVANSYQNIPFSDLMQLIIVGKEFDAADQYIIDQVGINDIVITADIPLAAKVLKKKANVLDPRGKIYTENNIGLILSMRDFMKEFRDAGLISTRSASFDSKDASQFANSLNKLLS